MGLAEELDAVLLAELGPDPDWQAEPEPAVDVVQADRYLLRLHHLAAREADVRQAAQARREVIDAQEAAVLAPIESRRAHLLASLEGYMRARHADDPKLKSVALPAGKLRLRKVPDHLDVDETLFIPWAAEHAPTAVVTRVRVDRNEVKALLRQGLQLEGVTTTPKPPSFSYDLAAEPAAEVEPAPIPLSRDDVVAVMGVSGDG